jgi:signal transduction histidine kinase
MVTAREATLTVVEPGSLTSGRLAMFEPARESPLSPGSQLDGLCELAARALRVPTVVAFLDDGVRLRLVGRYGLAKPWGSDRQVPLPASLGRRMIAENRPLIINDTRLEPEWHDNRAVGQFGIACCLGYPIRDPAGDAIGALLAWDDTARQWDESDLAAVREGARQVQLVMAAQAATCGPVIAAPSDVGVGLGGASDVGVGGRVLRWGSASPPPAGRPIQSTGEPADARRVSAEQVKDCELATTRALARAGSVSEAVPSVLDAVATTLKWPHAELWLVDEVTSLLRPAAIWTAPGLDLTGFVPAELRCGQGLTGAACKRGEPVAVADLAVEHDFFAPETANRYGLRAALAVPVRSTGHGLGVLTFFGDTPEVADESMASLLSVVAAHIGQFLERRRAEELALQLARTKDEFVALVGHEMRTPLASIGAYTELLIDDPDTPAEQRAQMLSTIHRNFTTLRGIIEDLLDLAGLESGHIAIQPVPTDLAQLTRDGVVAIGRSAAGKNISLVADITGAVEATADPARIRQVLDNLLTNAVKYTPAGGRVTVTLTAEGDAVVLTVADTGIGIPPGEVRRLFQRFFRGSVARGEGIPGTGLGLTITRAIVEHHRGTITVADNRPGTTFTVRLPAGPAGER